MEQSPFLVERYFFVLEFFFDSVEAADHDVLANPDICFYLDLPVIAAWCDELAVSFVRLRVPDQDNGEHVDLLRVELCQRG